MILDPYRRAGDAVMLLNFDSIRASRTVTYDLSAGTYSVPTGPLGR